MDLKITPQNVQRETVRKLREAIMAGYFAPGTRLVESSLCEQLGVSRNSLREAIGVLAAEHLVVVVPNRGPSVATMELEEAEQIYETRLLLESEVAARAARRAEATHLQAMQRSLAAFALAVAEENRLARVSTTTAFYDALIAASGHRIMGGLIQGLLARINLLRVKSMDNPGRAQQSHTEMHALYEAIAARDPRAARSAARAHIEAARASARQMFSREDG